ncbi:phosphate ABC transporter permease subunit PstC [Capsulimonas corticalis]|nr:phosphate ABC transporter permease subunit PstC [Capsulimonas corticalis]
MTTTPINSPSAASSSPKKLVFPKASFSIRYGDRIYAAITFLASLSIFGIIVWLAVQLSSASSESIHKFGWGYITKSTWDETTDVYGILPYIFGTLYSSFLALLIAVPISIGSAVFLSELAPKWLRTPMTFLIELLAAIPSVVYGLWGIFVMLPWLKDHVMHPIANSRIPHIPILGGLFSGEAIGPSMMAAGIILAIMVIPFITAVTRDILKAIPKAQREGSYGLGATQWETISRVVIPFAKSGIVGAVMLGLGRALGETMAVTMLIGNQPPSTPNGISFSLFQPGYTMSSALANKFNEAGPGLNTSALVEIGLVLFFVTIVVNMAARLLVFYTAKDVAGGK